MLRTDITKCKVFRLLERMMKLVIILILIVYNSLNIAEAKETNINALVYKNDNQVESFLMKGDGFYKNHDYKQAIYCFQKVIQINPNNISVYFKLAFSYFLLHQIPEAILCYKNIIKIDPNNSDAYLSLGGLYGSFHKSTEAIFFLDKSIKIKSDNPYAYRCLGMVYEFLSQLDKAKINFNKAKEQFHAHRNSIEAKKTEQMMNILPSISAYDEIIKTNPNSDKAYIDLGMAYVLSYQPQEAMIYLQKSIQINPNNANAYYSLGIAYDELHQFQQAMPFFRKAIKIDPNDALSYFSLGLGYKSMKHYKEAKISFQKAKAIFQREGDALKVQKIDFFLNMEEFKEL